MSVVPARPHQLQRLVDAVGQSAVPARRTVATVTAVPQAGQVTVTLSDGLSVTVPNIGPAAIVGDTVHVEMHADQVVAVARLAPAWATFTPTWTASTTNPTIGNGTLTGRWIRQGAVVHMSCYLLIGSTTNLGSGSWAFSLPLTAANVVTEIGPAYTRSGVSDRDGIVERHTATTCRIRAHAQGDDADVSSGIYPFNPWASGAFAKWSLTYEPA